MDVHAKDVIRYETKIHWELEVIWHSGQGRSEAGAWDAKGKVDNSQVKEQTYDKQILVGPS